MYLDTTQNTKHAHGPVSERSSQACMGHVVMLFELSPTTPYNRLLLDSHYCEGISDVPQSDDRGHEIFIKKI